MVNSPSLFNLPPQEKGLFSQGPLRSSAPLAERMRPQDFSQFFGQEDLLGEGRPLRKLLDSGHLMSLLLWGPPGTGKTTLARLIASKTNAHFLSFSAVASKIQDVKATIEEARQRLTRNRQPTILFIDELHRFNKAQQDAFLPHVEEGTVFFIGATTENPSFEVIAPLLSRTQVFVLQPLSPQVLEAILNQALQDTDRGLGKTPLRIDEEARKLLIALADGDARQLLNTLEFAVHTLPPNLLRSATPGQPFILTGQDLAPLLGKKTWRYDKAGENHYNLISAYIKSMRDSDPDGALYWLARMIEAGEDPLFIARRMVIFASEDIGNADPQALLLAVAVFQAVERVGLPEGRINLAHGTTYLASAPKSNASYTAYLSAVEDARAGSFDVPLHLRNATTSFMKDAGYGQGYQYAHDLHQQGKEVKQTHFPPELGERLYYTDQK